MGKYYITTPIYYVNASPHIGHAYTQIAVDALSRYRKMTGDNVFFLTGTDEHGEKIEQASREAGFKRGDEKKFVDGITDNFRKAWSGMGIEYDKFIRTTDEQHKTSVQDLVSRIKDNGDIYEGEYDGWFCTPCGTFWSAKQSEDGLCPDCKRPLEKIKEKNYFFSMGKYRDWLIEYINNNPDFIMPEFRKNEVLGFLREELGDLCISRPKTRSPWGIELPFDKEYVVYVWFDALTNYISGPVASGVFEEMWPPDVHVIAKDILRHHAVYWPIMLKSAGFELPRTIFAHGWWKMGGEKMSKSRGNIADPIALASKYGVDAVRYFVLKAVSFGMDGVFSEEALVSTYNSDLANDLGNLLNRTLTMVDKYFGGVAPAAPLDPGDADQAERSFETLMRYVPLLAPEIHSCMTSPELRLKEALESIMDLVGRANKYIEESAPWTHAKKGNTKAIELIIADLLEVLMTVAVSIYPFMPDTSKRMWSQLGLGGTPDTTREVSDPDTGLEGGHGVRRAFSPGTRVSKGEPLFMRVKEETAS